MNDACSTVHGSVEGVVRGAWCVVRWCIGRGAWCMAHSAWAHGRMVCGRVQGASERCEVCTDDKKGKGVGERVSICKGMKTKEGTNLAERKKLGFVKQPPVGALEQNLIDNADVERCAQLELIVPLPSHLGLLGDEGLFPKLLLTQGV